MLLTNYLNLSIKSFYALIYFLSQLSVSAFAIGNLFGMVSIYLSTYVSVHPAIYPSIFLYIHLAIYLAIYLSIYLSFSLSIIFIFYSSTYIEIHLSFTRSTSSSIYLCTYLYIYPGAQLVNLKGGSKFICDRNDDIYIHGLSPSVICVAPLLEACP